MSPKLEPIKARMQRRGLPGLRRLKSLAVGGLLLVATSVHATPLRVVAGARIELGEVLPDAPEDLRGVDLGRSPPPGTATTLTGNQVRSQLRAAGFNPAELKIPSLIRIRAEGEKLSKEQLASLAGPAVQKALPAGVTLVKLQASAALTLSPETKVGRVLLPKLPKRVGTLRTTLSVELLLEHEVTHRLPLIAIVNLSERAARHDAEKGSMIKLLVRRHSATVSATGSPLMNMDVGQVGQFRVMKTGRILKARLTSPTEAEVVAFR